MFDATSPAESAVTSLMDLVDAQVGQTPDRIAAECDGRFVAYAQLWQDAERIARGLIEAGARSGDLIGLCVPRSIELLCALLGILRAGCAYVPLDASFPDRRLRTMIERASLQRIVVCGRTGLPDAIASSGAELFDLEHSAALANETALPRVEGSDRAYVLFTSGSTGEPNGVCVLHRNLVNFLLSMRASPGLAADDVLCAVTTLSFDIAGLEMYLPLTVGARILIATEDQAQDPNLLGPLLHESGATVLQTTPTQLRMLIDGGQIDRLSRLRLLVGGEAMPRDLANAVDAHCRELWNMYGPTETTVWSTIWRVRHGHDAGSVPLGHAIANTTIHVLDERGQPVPEGEHGEIWIGGAGVTQGYLAREDLTAERFRRDPFAIDGSRMYRTGDIGSLRAGILYFHGRADDQVKLRGFRIELGDVEVAAYGEMRVREAAATVREFGQHDARLVLYVAAAAAADDLAAELRKRLRDTLPPYMRPSHIVVLKALPHTLNGKIDRKNLPMPQFPAQPQSTGTGDTREQYVAGLWQQMIGIADIARADNFFELGGDSLLAVAMMTRVEREMGVRLNMLAIANGTLGTLAATLPRHAPAPAGRGWLSRTLSRLRRVRAS